MVRPSHVRQRLPRLWNQRKCNAMNDKAQTRRIDLINSMPDGERRRIANRLNCSEGHVSGVIHGKRSQSTELGINIILMSEKSLTVKKIEEPRYRRLDLINSMPSGEQRRISRILKCSGGHVSAVLNGKRNQNNDLAINIIRLAEHSAAMELGKRSLSSFKKFRV